MDDRLVSLAKAALQSDVIVVNATVARVLGYNAAALLRELAYWSGKGGSEEGWVFRTQEELEADIFLTRYQQETARQRLRDAGIIREERRGIPCRMYFQIDWEAVAELVAGEQSVQSSPGETNGTGKLPASMRETNGQSRNVPADYIRGSSQGKRQGEKLARGRAREAGSHSYPAEDEIPVGSLPGDGESALAGQEETAPAGEGEVGTALAGKMKYGGGMRMGNPRRAGSDRKALANREKQLRGWFDVWFDKWWPNQLAKEAAWLVFRKIAPDEQLMYDILDKTKEWRASWQWRQDNGAYVPRADKWLRDKRWLDPAPPPEPVTLGGGGFSYIED